uniref:Uncharacterized protein n=1 Tax=Meloidogyne enterolobii TaxID=390850 RepID=A0A6V7VML1_MELEN|nr:unnamed protein product [Meloidogyne enterolobii]
MIGLFNIPCDSPIEFYALPPPERHFTFPLTPEENLLIATFGGKEKAKEKIGTKYLTDKREFVERDKEEPLSSTEAWKLLIHRSQLLRQYARLESPSDSIKAKIIKNAKNIQNNPKLQSSQSTIVRRQAFRISSKEVNKILRKYK